MKIHDNVSYQKRIDELDAMSVVIEDDALLTQKINELEEIAIKKNDTILKAVVTYHKSDIPYRNIDFETVKKYMNKTLQLCQEVNLTYYIVRSYNTLAIIASEESDFYDSISNYLKALSISNQHPEYAYACPILNNIGNLFVWLNEYESALDYLLQSYDKYFEEKITSTYIISMIILNIVEVYSLLEEYDKATTWAAKDIEYYHEARDFIDANLLINKIDLLYKNNDRQKIVQYTKQIADCNGKDGFIYAFRCLMRLLKISIREKDEEVASQVYARLKEISKDTLIHTFKYDFSVLSYSYYETFQAQNDDGAIAKKILKQFASDSAFAVIQFRNTYSRRLIMESEILKIKAEKERAINTNLQLQKDIELDYFTHILNKVYLEKYVDEAIQAKEEQTYQAMFLIDIDYFKAVNDTFGHERGDEIILNVVDTISSSISKDMLFGRFGGDEFVLFIKNAKQKEFFSLFANELLKKARSIHITKEKNITLSIGIGIVTSNNTDFKEILTLSDNALYTAKNNGRNQFVINEKEKHL